MRRVAVMGGMSDRMAMEAVASAFSMSVNQMTAQLVEAKRVFDEGTVKLRALARALDDFMDMRLLLGNRNSFVSDNDQALSQLFNADQRRRITTMSNVWRRPFYRRMGFHKSGFIGRIAKRRKGKL